jgi:pyridoxine kinase
MNILSLQSHVVYGHVGNSAAVFPLQRLGHEVWALHTVSFSNHPKHGRFRGHASCAGQLQELIAGLDDLGLMARCDAVLTGYFGDVTAGQIIVDTVQTIRAQNPDVVFCCDPVMGHEQDGFFVPEDLRALFRASVVPMADIVTPNQFELEFLTDRSLSKLTDAVQACEELRNQGPGYVIVTSLAVREVSDQQIGTLVVGPDGAWLVTTPRLSGDLFGAGDLFAALFLGNYLADRNVPAALASAVSTAYGVLKATVEAGVNELEIIRAQDEIALPSQLFEVKRVA